MEIDSVIEAAGMQIRSLELMLDHEGSMPDQEVVVSFDRVSGGWCIKTRKVVAQSGQLVDDDAARLIASLKQELAAKTFDLESSQGEIATLNRYIEGLISDKQSSLVKATASPARVPSEPRAPSNIAGRR